MLTCKRYILLPNNNKYHLDKGCVCEPSRAVNLWEKCKDQRSRALTPWTADTDALGVGIEADKGKESRK